MNILEEIIEHKKEEVRRRKSEVSVAELEKRNLFSRPVLSLKDFLLDKSRTGIIAEFKRRSPSKGKINDTADVVEVTKGYAGNGASCLSVLTDEYQVIESRSIGADVILLIAGCLSPAEVERLATFAKGLGLEVLLELHAEEELDHICDATTIIGINNRNLKTFEVDIERSLRMAEKIPLPALKVAESGITSVENILLFKQHGFHGFLIGENFMKATSPTIAFAEFVKQLKAKST